MKKSYLETVKYRVSTHIELRNTLMNLIKDSSVGLHVLKKRVKATRKTKHKIVHG